MSLICRFACLPPGQLGSIVETTHRLEIVESRSERKQAKSFPWRENIINRMGMQFRGRSRSFGPQESLLQGKILNRFICDGKGTNYRDHRLHKACLYHVRHLATLSIPPVPDKPSAHLPSPVSGARGWWCLWRHDKHE